MLNRRLFMRTSTFFGSLLGLSSVSLAATRLAANGPIRDAALVTTRQHLNVFDFLSDAEIDQIERNGTAHDLSSSLQKAINTNKPLIWPAGTYACNVTIPHKIRMSGAGPSLTIIRPFSTSTAAFTYTERGTDWTFHSVFEGLGFYGTGKVGVAFTFSKTNPASYAAGDEYSGRTTFENCYFDGLDKGIQAPFGNIGVYINQCGFGGNRYGLYSINNKFGGFMHAGNKYFRGGEFHSNDCAVYIHNTQDGFGAVEFDGTVFEGNVVAGYFYHNSPPMISPFSLTNYWSEANGINSPGAPKRVTVDAWRGTTRSTQSIAAHAWIIDGENVHAEFEKGFFSDCLLKATNSVVISEHDRFESEQGYGGALCAVDDPATSRIIVRDMICDSGGAQVRGIIADGTVTQSRRNIDSSGSGSSGRANLITARSCVGALNHLLGSSVHFDTRQDLSGSIAIPAKVVSDGLLYSTCNEYTVALTNGQIVGAAGTNTPLSVGWWIWTGDIKVVSGTPSFKVWDRSINQMATWTAFADGLWHTWGGLGYLSTGSPSVFLDLIGTNLVPTTFRMSAFQMKKFATMAEAQDFLSSRVYAA